MDNQHKLIKGYRDLTQDEINLMNRCKGLEKDVLDLIGTIATKQSIDVRWLAIGKTDIQTGFMAIVRSIARPGE